ncbi:MAG: ORF6N domain-containing protein [Gammaproteobacteria bacterium]|nr:ORF6N domain-containing protein [Gammaproteobacteria bacterium]
MGQPTRPDGDAVTRQIRRLRGQAILLDADLALLYGVETKVLLQAVRRNKDRFPPDFLFQINTEEWSILRSQFVTSRSWGGRRSRPWAFTEHGALQLANVLKSKRAIAVSLMIVRVFVRLRQWAQTNRELVLRLNELERRVGANDASLQELLEAIRQLIARPEPTSRPIGFTADLDTPKS